MKKIFEKYLSAPRYVAVVVGIMIAAVIAFVLAGIINLIFYYSI